MVDILQKPKKVKVRKDHICQGCGKKIIKGEKATYSKYVGDGLVWYFYECSECREYYKDNCSDCKDYRECIGENYELGIIKECRYEKGDFQ